MLGFWGAQLGAGSRRWQVMAGRQPGWPEPDSAERERPWTLGEERGSVVWQVGLAELLGLLAAGQEQVFPKRTKQKASVSRLSFGLSLWMGFRIDGEIRAVILSLHAVFLEGVQPTSLEGLVQPHPTTNPASFRALETFLLLRGPRPSAQLVPTGPPLKLHDTVPLVLAPERCF